MSGECPPFPDVVRDLAERCPELLEVKAHWIAVTLDDRRDVVAQVTDGEIRWNWGGLAIFQAALVSWCVQQGWQPHLWLNSVQWCALAHYRPTVPDIGEGGQHPAEALVRSVLATLAEQDGGPA
ncbi:hypothetical protein Dcar01_02806 [Deinococcus carri]|uniref:Uncharacterized protein n=1 Tax=Deinococcus carri TaxID=1211323 RepID=A0ABP9WCU4_9DEIO